VERHRPWLDSRPARPLSVNEALDRLLANGALRERLARAGEAIRTRDGVARAAAIIEGAAAG
jgi:UDP:flavonoid glycosyltransferase YjiC (YdhE family)